MIAIIDYEAGNLTSVGLATQHVGGTYEITQSAETISKADHIIFPGVGSAQSCMDNLRRFKMDIALKDAISSGKPVLAICIGMQLLFEHTDEDGGVDCLGILPGTVKRFSFPKEKHVKIPHMGWNSIEIKKQHPIFEGFPENGECYFVHSYFAATPRPEHIFATTEYEDIVFTCAVGRDNLFATQFHPEKSGNAGLTILRNFLKWTP